MRTIVVTDQKDQDHEFSGEGIYLKVEGVHTLVIYPNTNSPAPAMILGVFDNVTSAKIEGDHQ